MTDAVNRNFELLEPYDAKVSRTVLRGEGGSNAPDLLDVIIFLAAFLKHKDASRYACTIKDIGW